MASLPLRKQVLDLCKRWVLVSCFLVDFTVVSSIARLVFFLLGTKMGSKTGELPSVRERQPSHCPLKRLPFPSLQLLFAKVAALLN